MKKERRKFLRSECLLPADLIKSDGKDYLDVKTTVQDLTRKGLKLVVNVNFKPGSSMELKLLLPEKNLSTTLSAEVAWRKFVKNKLEIGLRIKDMDKRAKKEILNWIFPTWLETKIKQR